MALDSLKTIAKFVIIFIILITIQGCKTDDENSWQEIKQQRDNILNQIDAISAKLDSLNDNGDMTISKDHIIQLSHDIQLLRLSFREYDSTYYLHSKILSESAYFMGLSTAHWMEFSKQTDISLTY